MESRLVRDGIRCCGEAIDGLPFLMFLVSVTALSKSWSTLLTLIVHELKNRISKPFDFQHLTHTDRHQVAALEQSSGDTLDASYRSVNALLNPRNLLPQVVNRHPLGALPHLPKAPKGCMGVSKLLCKKRRLDPPFAYPDQLRASVSLVSRPAIIAIHSQSQHHPDYTPRFRR
jgi:hypothetical protein